MAYVSEVFKTNFLEYASYVIKDRAIPHIDDGLKPVQRRILHSLFELDDGKFNKVANVVGNCMKYHPHGDASIYSALVAFANKDLFIDKQG
ncbi:MAG: DNA topoisomerase IV subunit A, partial [Deltaproteobacteria bacterium]|nr:DNA topoisomerase IV subunit A [Deltaproteobacteria bacterium]